MTASTETKRKASLSRVVREFWRKNVFERSENSFSALRGRQNSLAATLLRRQAGGESVAASRFKANVSCERLALDKRWGGQIARRKRSVRGKVYIEVSLV